MPNRKELQNKTNKYPGIQKIIRENKRIEAELRDEDTLPERTRAYRLGREKITSEKAEVSHKDRKRKNRKADEQTAELHAENAELLKGELV